MDARNSYVAAMLVGKVIYTYKYCLKASFKLTGQQYVTFLHPDIGK
jgi:hypothetical protein